MNIDQHSVIQITENGPQGWVGCLAIVDEVKSFGVQAGVHIPKGGVAYIRLLWDQFEVIGKAVLIINPDI